MQRVSLVFLCWLVAVVTVADEPNVVELRIFDGDATRSGVAVRIGYPDPERTSGGTLELVTDDKGVVAFHVPADVFWVTVPELNDKVVGKEFRIQRKARKIHRWDLRPRAWKQDIGVTR